MATNREGTLAGGAGEGRLPASSQPSSAREVGGAEQQGDTSAPFDLRRAALAVLLGVVVYLALYAFAEVLVYRYGDVNPFYRVSTADVEEPQIVILGASRALPLAYDGMGAEVEERLDGPVMNLASEGSGILPNLLIMEYFLREHGPDETRAVVYVLDTFAFQSSAWNEERLRDAQLWQRAPLDPQLVTALGHVSLAHGAPASVFWRYLSGFSKLNDPASWFVPDEWQAESGMDDSYSPSAFEDDSRLSFLYPDTPDSGTLERYEEQLTALAVRLQEQGIPILVVFPPLRSDFVVKIPDEQEWRSRAEALLTRLGVPFVEAEEAYDESHFMDPDHLNRRGARRFLDSVLAPALASTLR